MAPPKFADLSKAVNDLFKKDFGAGESKLTVNTKTAGGVGFKVEGIRKDDSGAVGAKLETKFTHAASGLNVTETWSSDNTVNLEIEAKDKVQKGTTFTATTVLTPNSPLVKSFKLAANFQNKSLNLNTEVGKKAGNADLVFATGNVRVGAAADIDVAGQKVTKTTLALGISESDFSVATTIDNSFVVNANFHHKVAKDLEYGVRVGWAKGQSGVTAEIASKYVVDRDSFWKVKIDKNCALGLGFTTKVQPGVALTLAANVNAAQLNSDKHKLGFHLNFSN